MKHLLLTCLLAVSLPALMFAQGAATDANQAIVKISSLPFTSGSGSCGVKGFSSKYWQFTPGMSGVVNIHLITQAEGVALMACSGNPNDNTSVSLGEMAVQPGSSLKVQVEAGKAVYVQAYCAKAFTYAELSVSAPATDGNTSATKLSAMDSRNTSELLALSAEPTTTTVRLYWAVPATAPVSGFDVQRSTDAKSFESLGWVSNQADRKSFSNCEMIDTTAEEGTMYYYRLRMVDADHNSAFSRVTPAVIKNKGIVIYDVYGSKDEQGSYLRYLLSRPTVVTVEISDKNGTVLKSYKQGLQAAGSYTVPFPGKPAEFREGKLHIDLWCDDERFAIASPDGE